MKKLLVMVFLSIIFIRPGHAQKILSSKIDTVRVFTSGAQIQRSFTTEIPRGSHELVLKGLSPYLDNESIRVTGMGEFIILSVNHTINHLDSLAKNSRIDSLENSKQNLELSLERRKNRLEILLEKEALLDKNSDLGGYNENVTMEQLNQALTFFENQLESIKTEKSNINMAIRELNSKLERIISEIKSTNGSADQPVSEIKIKVRSESPVKAKFNISYLVANAGWFPKYDIRVVDIEKPVQIIYKAEIFQQTGENWDNVNLTFTNSTPYQNGNSPELVPWHIGYQPRINYLTDPVAGFSASQISGNKVTGIIRGEEGFPLPGANVIVKGTTIGTLTDINGQFSLILPHPNSELSISLVGFVSKTIPVSGGFVDFSMKVDHQNLNDLAITGYGVESKQISIRGIADIEENYRPETVPLQTQVNQTTVDFNIDIPYTIHSGPEKMQIELSVFDIPASYQYVAIPKLDRDAFLTAKITEWQQYQFLEGEANLYFENSYVGRTILNARAIEDTLSISLGRDKSIVIQREKKREHQRKVTIGLNQIDEIGFEIKIKNNKNIPINISVLDQIPISTNNEIKVNIIEVGKAIPDEAGIVKWDLTVNSFDTETVNLKYEVKFPKNQRVVLE